MLEAIIAGETDPERLADAGLGHGPPASAPRWSRRCAGASRRTIARCSGCTSTSIDALEAALTEVDAAWEKRLAPIHARARTADDDARRQ